MQENFDLHAYQEVVQYLLKQNCTISDIEALVKMCPSIFQMTLEEFERKITMLFNANIFYGLIICDKNEYHYYLIHQFNQNPSFKEPSEYIVKTVIDGTKKQYLQKITGIKPDDTLETKLFKMKQLKFNSSGYQIK